MPTAIRTSARQFDVARDVAAQLAQGEQRIVGVMVESNINEGRQGLSPETPGIRRERDGRLPWLGRFGLLLELLAQGVRARRLAAAAA